MAFDPETAAFLDGGRAARLRDMQTFCDYDPRGRHTSVRLRLRLAALRAPIVNR